MARKKKETPGPRSMPPRRLDNDQVRGREWILPTEAARLIKAALKVGRHGARDALMIRLAYYHGLRCTELVRLRRDQVNLHAAQLTVTRLKGGLSNAHPLLKTELKELKAYLKTAPDSAFVFVTERGGPLTQSTFFKIVQRAGREAKLDISVHPHMLRHGCGYKMANEGTDTRTIQHYLGHQNIQNTVGYTAMSADRFKGIVKE